MQMFSYRELHNQVHRTLYSSYSVDCLRALKRSKINTKITRNWVHFPSEARLVGIPSDRKVSCTPFRSPSFTFFTPANPRDGNLKIIRHRIIRAATLHFFCDSVMFHRCFRIERNLILRCMFSEESYPWVSAFIIRAAPFPLLRPIAPTSIPLLIIIPPIYRDQILHRKYERQWKKREKSTNLIEIGQLLISNVCTSTASELESWEIGGKR